MTWAAMRDRMNKTIMRTLADGAAEYLSATGAVLARGVEVIMERDVERLDDVSGGAADLLRGAADDDVHVLRVQPEIR